MIILIHNDDDDNNNDNNIIIISIIIIIIRAPLPAGELRAAAPEADHIGVVQLRPAFLLNFF